MSKCRFPGSFFVLPCMMFSVVRGNVARSSRGPDCATQIVAAHSVSARERARARSDAVSGLPAGELFLSMVCSVLEKAAFGDPSDRRLRLGCSGVIGRLVFEGGSAREVETTHQDAAIAVESAGGVDAKAARDDAVRALRARERPKTLLLELVHGTSILAAGGEQALFAFED